MMQDMQQMEAVQCITVARIEWQEDSTPWFQIWLYEQLAAYKRSTKTWWMMTWWMMMITKATGWVARKESLSVSGKESPSVSGFGLKEEMGTSYENLFVRQTTPTHTHTRICAHPHTRTHIITHTRTHTRTHAPIKSLNHYIGLGGVGYKHELWFFWTSENDICKHMYTIIYTGTHIDLFWIVGCR